MKEVAPKPVAKAPAAKTQTSFFGHTGEQQPFIAREADDHAFFQMPIQTKLTVGAPNSPAEEEADRMAEQVVQRLAQPESVQRQCADCEKEEVKRQPEEKELQEKPLVAQIQRHAAPEDLDKENPAVARKATPDEDLQEDKLQRQAEEEKDEQIAAKEMPEEDQKEQIAAKPDTIPDEKKDEVLTKSNGEATVNPGIASRLSSSKGGGHPLSESVRSPMEQAFGADFSGVQIHTGTEAAQLSQDLQAQAFTHGQDVYFNAGKYQPETTEGKRLLGHELTHVVQGGTEVIRKEDMGINEFINKAITIGFREVREVDEKILERATVEQRVSMIILLVNAWWTGNSEEESIIRILDTTPQDQCDKLIKELSSNKIEESTVLEKIDQVIDMGNNLELHAVLSKIKIKSRGEEKGVKELEEAPILPWHDVMGFFEDDATFKITTKGKGEVYIEYPSRTSYAKDFGDEPKKLEKRYGPNFFTGHTFSPDQILIIHDYDLGKFVPIVASELIGYKHSRMRGFYSHMGTVVSTALSGGGGGAAKTLLGRIIMRVDQAFNIFSTIIDENRLNIVKWFPNWGAKMLYYFDVKT